MDSELVRTYLTVLRMGSFAAAGERLHVTQSTVSARIRTLEDQLGVRLFNRSRDGASLTREGRRFHRHAAAILRSVEAARHELGRPSRHTAALTIGARFGLWEQLLVHSLPELRRQLPEVSIRAQIGFEEELICGLAEGRVDIALMYAPEGRAGLAVERLLEERLILAGTARPPALPAEEGYVFIDWGAPFRGAHATSFPDFAGAGLTASVGWLGLQLILANGGSGYLPRCTVAPYLASGRLFAHPQAPEFALTAYLVYPCDQHERPAVNAAVAALHGFAPSPHISPIRAARAWR